MAVNNYIKVLEDQSLFDIAIQEYGSIEGVKQLIIDNPTTCSFEDDPVPGTLLLISGTVINQDIVQLLKDKKIKPANKPANGGFSSGFSYGFNI
jgi:hypothetical protein